ncbi:MAG: secretin N-terminal domain-containing protein [Pseudomonadota bacterium]
MLLLNLAGCSAKEIKSTQEKKPEKPVGFLQEWEKKAETSRGKSPTPRGKLLKLNSWKDELRRQGLAATPVKPLPTDRITAQLKDLEVSVILRVIAKAVNVNLMINDEIKGKATIEVKKVPWNQVFLGLLRMQGLTYAWEGDVIRVMKYEVKQQEDNREFHTVVIPIEFITDPPPERDEEGRINPRKKEGAGNLERLRLTLQAILDQQPVESGDSEGKNLVASMSGLTPTPIEQAKKTESRKRGVVMIDEHNNSLIIHAPRENLVRLIPLIEALDKPTRQVLIEAHIVEATKETAYELGIQWGGLLKDGNGGYIYPGGASSGIFNQILGNIDPTTGIAGNFPASLGTEGAGLQLGALTSLMGGSILAAQLSALEQNNKLNILSSPSITTLDNHAASIESGVDVPFQTIDENGRIKIEFKSALLRLEVLPHIIEDRLLKLNIFTTKEELDTTNEVSGYPTIITKKAQTNVILLDGETTVIGGLKKNTGQGLVEGVPFLKDVPLLGYLFRHTGESDKFEDVLIFLTPHILEKEQIVDMDRTAPPSAPGGDGSQDRFKGNGILQDSKSFQ